MSLLLAMALLSWPVGLRRHRALGSVSGVAVRVCLVAIGSAAAVIGAVTSGSAVVGLAVLVALPTVWWLWHSSRSQRHNRRLRAAEVESVRALARELGTGRSLDNAVGSVAAQAHSSVAPMLERLAAGARLEGAVSVGSGPVESSIHAALRMSRRFGVPLAGLMSRIADGVYDQMLADEQRAAAVAGAKLSGYLLAGLPVVGVLLGVGMGANPLPVLFGGGLGSALLLAGVTLSCAGLLWSARIAR